jgi:L-fucose isomerase-like protein
MGFHCGNTPVCKLKKEQNTGMKFQLIMNRLMENKGTPDITRGTVEGNIIPGDITFYRVHGNADGSLQAYIAQGEVLPVPARSFGGIGIFAIPEMGRFYRHVLVGKHYPHHGAVVFGRHGKSLFTVFDYLGVPDIAYNRPKNLPYERENPFA